MKGREKKIMINIFFFTPRKLFFFSSRTLGLNFPEMFLLREIEWDPIGRYIRLQSDFFLTGIHIWQFFLSSLPNVTFLLKFLPPSSRSFFSPTLFVILKPKHDLSTTDWMCVYTFSSSSSTCVYLLLSAVNILVTYFSY